MSELTASERAVLRKDLAAADLVSTNERLVEEVSQVQLRIVEVLRENFKLRIEVDELRKMVRESGSKVIPPQAEVPKQITVPSIPLSDLKSEKTPQDGSDFESEYSGETSRGSNLIGLTKLGITPISPRSTDQLRKALNDMQSVVKKFETAHVMAIVEKNQENESVRSAPEPLVRSPFLKRVISHGDSTLKAIRVDETSRTPSVTSARSDNKFEKTKSRINILTNFLDQPRKRLASGAYNDKTDSATAPITRAQASQLISEDTKALLATPPPEPSPEELVIPEKPMERGTAKFHRSKLFSLDDIEATETKPKSLMDTLADLDDSTLPDPTATRV